MKVKVSWDITLFRLEIFNELSKVLPAFILGLVKKYYFTFEVI
jgi:hypothetical protein